MSAKLSSDSEPARARRAQWASRLDRSGSLLLVASLGLAACESGPDVSNLMTVPEATNFEQTSHFDDVVAFMDTVAMASRLIQLTTFATTTEGRDLPLAVVGHVDGTSPEDVMATGLTRVYLQGNIHGGEVEGKESLQIFLREVALGQHDELLDSLVLLVAPIYNADGNERFELDHRGAQNGPVAGMGQRPNAQGYDLNRDHMKLDSPEARGLIGLLDAYDPHVGIDLHTTNGTTHAYYVTYSPPLHPNTPSEIDAFLRDQWLPEVTQTLLDEYGWNYYHYGNAQGAGRGRGGGGGGRGRAGRAGGGGGDAGGAQGRRGGGGGGAAQEEAGPGRWVSFDDTPRYNNNYIGLRNRFAILSEAYSYATFEDRILATSRFVEELLEFAYAHATEIRQITERADAESVVGQELALSADASCADTPIDILMGETENITNPISGSTMRNRLDVVTPTPMFPCISYVGTEMETAPAAYLIPPDPRVDEAIGKLEAHGVRMERLNSAQELSVQRFRIDSTWVAPNAFQDHNERTVVGAYVETTMTLPVGTVVIPVDQPLGRLAFSLLEPRSDDGLSDWNFLDAAIEGAEFYPVVRSMQPVTVSFGARPFDTRGSDSAVRATPVAFRAGAAAQRSRTGGSALTADPAPAAVESVAGALPRVRLGTALGQIVLEIDSVAAPITATNFLRYVDAGAYTGGQFHRTVREDNQPNDEVKIAVIQARRRRGPDSPRFDPIPLERTNATGLSHTNGALSMARSGPDTATSDFFITIGDQTELDFGGRRNADGQGFAVFGRVTEGMDVVERIWRSPAQAQTLNPTIDITGIARVAG